MPLIIRYFKVWFLGVTCALLLGMLQAVASKADVNGLPGPPLQPRITVRASNYLEVTWETPTENSDAVIDYEVRYSSDYGSTWVAYDDGESTSTNLRIMGLELVKSYGIQIRSVGSSSASRWAVTGDTVTQVEVAGVHSCTVLVTGEVKCWGSNSGGELGDGTTTNRSTPVLVSGISTDTSVSAGGSHSCAVLATGEVKCWGSNSWGELGDGSTTNRSTPVLVSGVTAATSVSAGTDHSCAVLATGEVKCWGSNSAGQLGDRSLPDGSTVLISGISTATSVSAGGSHSCAVLATGEVKCWGSNGRGQLGDGTTTNRSTPVLVSGISTATSVSAGTDHSCAVLVTRRVKCWGGNGAGQLGDGTTTNRSIPVLVSGISTVISVSAGPFSSCAVLAAGEVKCWGRNYAAQWGNGLAPFRSTPVLISGIPAATSVSVGGMHSCAVLAAGEVKCWGFNGRGQLGNGTSEPIQFQVTPVFVLGFGAKSYDFNLPAAPSATSVTLQSRTASTITMSWTAPNAGGLPVDNYRIEWSPNGSSWSEKDVTGSGTNLTGLAAGATYQVRVSAHSDAGWGAATTSTFSTLPVLTYKTGARVAGLAAVGKSLIALPGAWTAAPKATFTYQWYSCTKASKTVSTVGKVATGCKAISGATKSSLKLTTAHKKLYMAALITAKNTAGTKKVFTATVGPVK
jgi:alpha-tubulin suppressor-like RCC1 family protein